MNPKDQKLRSGLIRVAKTLPKGDAGRKQILKIVADFDAGSIGKKQPGPISGVPGSEEQELKGEFTQQENSELREKKETGKMAVEKKAAVKIVRRMVAAAVMATMQGDTLRGRITVDLKVKGPIENTAIPIRFTAKMAGQSITSFDVTPSVSGAGAPALLAFYQELVQEAVNAGLVATSAPEPELIP